MCSCQWLEKNSSTSNFIFIPACQLGGETWFSSIFIINFSSLHASCRWYNNHFLFLILYVYFVVMCASKPYCFFWLILALNKVLIVQNISRLIIFTSLSLTVFKTKYMLFKIFSFQIKIFLARFCQYRPVFSIFQNLQTINDPASISFIVWSFWSVLSYIPENMSWQDFFRLVDFRLIKD